MLSPEHVALAGYIMCLVFAPLLSLILVVAGRGTPTRWLGYGFAAVLMTLWAPLAFAADRVIASLI